MEQQGLSTELNNFFCETVNSFLENEDLEKFYTTRNGYDYWYSKANNQSLKTVNYWKNRYSEKQQKGMVAIVERCLRQSNREHKEALGWCFIEGRINNILIVSDFQNHLFCSVPDGLVSELRQLANHDKRLVYSKTEFTHLLKTDENNVLPLRRYKLPIRASERVSCPKEVLAFLDDCNDDVFNNTNVIYTEVAQTFKYKGESVVVTVKEGCEEFLAIYANFNKAKFEKYSGERENRKNYMNYPNGAMFYTFKNLLWAEIRIGSHCSLFKIPSEILEKSKNYAQKVDLLFDLEDFISINTTNNVDK
jgi:hypothetical protein